MSAKTVIIANPHGFCAGVRHAVNITDTALRRRSLPVYALNEIVHNRQVVDSFEKRGVRFVRNVADVPPRSTLIFSAHGVAPSVRADAAARGLEVIDATCPFVTKVHKEVIRYAREGCSIALVGHRGHDEVIGIAGEAPGHVTVLENCADAEAFTPQNPQRVAVVTQTTLSAAEAETVIAVLRRRFPDLLLPKTSDICYATTNRQQAVRRLAELTRVILVLGAANSSNTRRLAEVARDAGATAHLISRMADLDGSTLAHATTIGLTAGASTPETFVQEVLAALATLGFSDVQHLHAAEENITFPLPRALADQPS